MEHHLNQVHLNQVQVDPMQLGLPKLDTAHSQLGQINTDHFQRNLAMKIAVTHPDPSGMGGLPMSQNNFDQIHPALPRLGQTEMDSHQMPMSFSQTGGPTRQINMDNRPIHASNINHMKPGQMQMNQANKTDGMSLPHMTINRAELLHQMQEQLSHSDQSKNIVTENAESVCQDKQDESQLDNQNVQPALDSGPLSGFKFDAMQIEQVKGVQAQFVKRKRVVWDIPTKIKILERLGNGERAVDLAREYGVGRSTISDMKSTESKLREFLSHSNNDSRSRCTMKMSADENLDRLLYNWFIDERSKGTYISGPIIREKAKWFHLQLHPGDTTFAASQGWLRRWKQRHGVTGSVFNLFLGKSKSSGRRGRVLEIPDKLKIIERLDNGEQVADLAKEYGVGKTTITAVMSAKAKLMVYQIQSDPTKTEKYLTKFACYENVDKALYTWYLEERNKSTQLSGPIIKEKAKWFHDTMYPGNNFKASEGWLWRWKKRNSITGPIGSNSTGNKPENDGCDSATEKDTSEQETDTATKIKAIESSIAHIKSEESKLRKRIYKRRKGKEEECNTEQEGEKSMERKPAKETPDRKRKRVVLDIPTKLKIIERVNNGERPVDLAREFGLGRSTITDIKLSEARLKTFVSTNESGTRKRQTMRQPTYESVDKALYSWFVEETQKGTQLPGNVLRDRARLLHSQHYPDDSPFLASEGWLRRWKERHGLLSPTKSTKGSHNAAERKKRIVLDISTKMEILDRLQKGENLKVLAREFGVSKTTVNDIKSAEGKLKEYMASCGKSTKRKLNTVEQCHTALNQAMYIWYLQEKDKKSSLSWPELEARAIWFHTQLHPNCNVSVSSSKWLSEWKSYYGVYDLSYVPETSLNVCQAVEMFRKHLAEWMGEIDIGPEQLYSVEESTLYWNRPPKKAHTCASESDVLDYQRHQDKVTLLTCTNSCGSHKLPVLLLGQSEDPESLKLLDMSSLSVAYAFQKHASITSEIFTNWFKTQFVPEVEKHLISKGLPQRAALLVKNIPAHMPSLEVETADGRIECVFLPISPDTDLNPMNQGIVQFLKHHFRKNLVHKLISLKSHLTDIFQNLSLCDCILMIDSAWKCLTEHHILKSWEKSSLMQCFPNSGQVPEVPELNVDTIGLSVIQEAFNASLCREDSHEWLNCDRDISAYKVQTDSEIVDYVRSLSGQEKSMEDAACNKESNINSGADTSKMFNVKQETAEEYVGGKHIDSNDSDSENSSLSHVQYFSFSQSEDVSEEMPEGTSKVVNNESADFDPALVVIKTEPEDYDSDCTVAQDYSDPEQLNTEGQLNANAEDDLTEEEYEYQNAKEMRTESKEIIEATDNMSSTDDEES